MREDLVNHDVLRVGLQRGFVHGSISFKRVLRLASRSRQNTPVVAHPVDERGEALGLCAIIDVAALGALGDQAGLFQ